MTRGYRSTWSVSVGVVLLAIANGLFAAPAVGQEMFHLVSAQVVTSNDRPARLRLAASGPIAFHVVTEEEGGPPANGAGITVRLYGVRPGQLATLDGLQPFAVIVTAAGSDSLVTISAAGLASGARLQVRAGQRSQELDISVAGT